MAVYEIFDNFAAINDGCGHIIQVSTVINDGWAHSNNQSKLQFQLSSKMGNGGIKWQCTSFSQESYTHYSPRKLGH